MATRATKTYEAMFLLDTSAKPLETLQEDVRQSLSRHGVQILRAEKWVERKLAYPIAQKKRGTYYVVFFEAPPAAIDALNKDVAMRGIFLRVMFLENPRGKDAKVPPPPEEGERIGGPPRFDREFASPGIGH